MGQLEFVTLTQWWMEQFRQRGALWLHNRDSARPHAILASGMHSDGYVNCTKLVQSPQFLHLATGDRGFGALLRHISPHWVIGCPMGAITLAHVLADKLTARAGFTEKDGESMKLSRFEIEAAATVLVVEDVVTTGESTLKTIAAIKSAQPSAEVLPMVFCLVNRSGSDRLPGTSTIIHGLLTLSISTWKPEECPLCKSGSQALKPKLHWAELTKEV